MVSERRRRVGARTKAPGGLSRVLFVRADSELVRRLESLRAKRIAGMRGVGLSTSDLVRALLWEAIERGERESSRVLVAPTGPTGDPLAGK